MTSFRPAFFCPAFFLGFCFVALPFLPILFDGDLTLLYRDLSQFHLPSKILWAEAVRELGRLPHWNPWHGGGVPYFPELQYAAFHPFNFLFLLFSPGRALVFFVFAHHVVIYGGGYLLFRSLRIRAELAALGAVSLAIGGFALSCENHLHELGGQMAMPFFFYFWRRYLRQPGALLLALAALALAFPVYVGGVQYSYVAAILAALWAVSVRGVWRGLASVAALGLLCVLAAAPELFPVLAEFRLSVRELAPAQRMLWSLHPARLWELIVALPFGDAWGNSEYRGYHFSNSPVPRAPFIFSFYPGLFCALLLLAWSGAYLVCARRRRRFRWGLLFLGAILLALSLGVYSPLPIYQLFGKVLPLWDSFRYPERLGYWFLGAWLWFGLVAGEKLFRLRGVGGKIRALWPGWFFGSLLAIALAWAIFLELPLAPFGRALLTGAGLFLLLYGGRHKIFLALAGLDIVLTAHLLVWPSAAAFTDLASYPLPARVIATFRDHQPEMARGGARRFFSLVSLAPRPADAEAVARAGALPAEVYRNWSLLEVHTPTFAGIEGVLRFSPLVPPDELLRAAGPSLANAGRYLDLKSVLVVLSQVDRRVYLNSGALPYLFFPALPEFVPDQTSALRRVYEPNFEPLRSAVLQAPMVGEGAGGELGRWRIEGWEKNWDQIKVHLRAEKAGDPAWLVVNESFHRGWTARVNGGAERPIVRANGWAQAVELPAAKAGQAVALDFSFTQPGFSYGVWAFTAWLSFFLGALVWAGAREKITPLFLIR